MENSDKRKFILNDHEVKYYLIHVGKIHNRTGRVEKTESEQKHLKPVK